MGLACSKTTHADAYATRARYRRRDRHHTRRSYAHVAQEQSAQAAARQEEEHRCEQQTEEYKLVQEAKQWRDWFARVLKANPNDEQLTNTAVEVFI
jgi:hypothetical protein